MTWGVQNSEEEAHQQLDYAINERGVNFIDTAEYYPVPPMAPGWKPGRTEEYIGTYLARHPDLRQKLIIATKVVGFAPNSAVVANRFPGKYENGEYPDGRLDQQSIREACDASLKRLQTDYIDLYQLHWPDRYVPLFGSYQYMIENERESIPFKETLLGLKSLLDAGKIRSYGLSNETTFGVAEIVRAADELGMPRPITIQNSFSLLDRRFETELAEACSPSHYNIGLLPWSILAGGTLSGKYLEKVDENGDSLDGSLDSARHVKWKNFMSRYHCKPAVAATAQYKMVADKAGISLATLAQAFCKTRFFIPSSIIGATSIEQLKENIDAFEVELSETTLAEIDRVHFSNKDMVAHD